MVQASHACIEATKAFLNPDLEHPHLIVFGIKDENHLHKAALYLDSHNIRYKIFNEPDRQDEATALTTEPIFGDQRALFRRFQCLKEKNENQYA